MTTKITLNWKAALKLSALLGLFWYMVAFLGYTGVINARIDVDIKVTEMFREPGRQFGINFFLFFALFCFQFSIINKTWKIKRKIWVMIAGSITIVFLFVAFTLALFEFLNMRQGGFPNMFFVLSYGIIISAITILLTALVYIIGEREKTIIENQKLLMENMNARYETLKSQINPHFLFNSLNTLNGLIGADDDKAKGFVEQLSFVFRYTIKNPEVTTLDDELLFIEAFGNLMKIRYGESLFIEYGIDKRYRSHLIIPLCLQMLVENAIKHNTISKRYPLTITIETTNNHTVRVWNKIQPQNEDTSGEGIGLANMSERYKMQYQKEIAISDTDGIFCVEIPLIKREKR